MSSRYRVDYYLKEHRRDELIQWLKSLLATPFVLSAVPDQDEEAASVLAAASYAEVFRSVEQMVLEHIYGFNEGNKMHRSRISRLVPSVGTFFTPLPLEHAFHIQDERRGISKRRLVAPSFNDVRLILNTAQVMQLAKDYDGKRLLKLVTFDGDITLYEDGKNLETNSPLIKYMLYLLQHDIAIGIVTAAGYTTAEMYYVRLHGLLDGVKHSEKLTPKQKERLLVMGGEANFLFQYNANIESLEYKDPQTWLLPEMQSWTIENMDGILDHAQHQLTFLAKLMNIETDTEIMRKERAVGLIPRQNAVLNREVLEEIVLRVDQNLKETFPTSNIEWCAFNGGRDIWVDIGDKSLGVRVLQNYLDGNIVAANTLHVGDQFASMGSNDYASRKAAATAWVASPWETESILLDVKTFIEEQCLNKE